MNNDEIDDLMCEDNEPVWEWLGISEDEYLQILDEDTNHDVAVSVGDVVLFDANAHYDNPDMEFLAKTHHCFLIAEIHGDEVIAYAMTSRVGRKSRFPKEYIEVQSGYKRALVQLNAWGKLNKKKIYRVIATLSNEDMTLVRAGVVKPHKRTTVCECLGNAVRVARVENQGLAFCDYFDD